MKKLKQSVSSSASKPWSHAPSKLVLTGVVFKDPNVILPIGVGLGGVFVLFFVSVSIYYTFKVEIVLWFRSTFPILYTDKGNTAHTGLQVTFLNVGSEKKNTAAKPSQNDSRWGKTNSEGFALRMVTYTVEQQPTD